MENINNFTMTSDLQNTIETIINNYEKEKYVCRIINYKEPQEIDEYDYNLSFYKNNGKCTEYNQDDQESYLVIMKEEVYKTLTKLSFRQTEDLEIALYCIADSWQEYYEEFDPAFIYQSFPYLNTFFERLQEFKVDAKNSVLNQAILDSCKAKVYQKNNK